MRRGERSFLAAVVSLLLVSGLAAAQFQAEIQKTEAEAYGELTSGAVWDGTVRLIKLLRDVPPDDAALADAMVGPAQLLGFSVAFLMDWGERIKLLGEVLDPAKYVTDKLLIAGLKVGGDLGQYETLRAVHDLQQIAKGEHEAAAATALCALSDSYYFRTFPHIQETSVRLYLNYGYLELARGLLRQSVRTTIRDSVNGDGSKTGTVFKNIVYAGGRADTVRAADPVLAKVTGVMNSFEISGIDAGLIGRWSELAVNDADPAVRRTCLLLTTYFENDPACKEAIGASRRAIAAQAPTLPEVPLARVMLLEDARKAKNFEELAVWTNKILGHGLLPATPERCLYENDMRAVQHAAESFTRYGLFGDAEQVYARLAAKYPESALSRECDKAVEALKDDPIAAALAVLDREAHALLRKGRVYERRQLYLDVAAATGNPALAGACRDRANGVSMAAPPERKPPMKLVVPPLFKPLRTEEGN